MEKSIVWNRKWWFVAANAVKEIVQDTICIPLVARKPANLK